MTRRATPRLRRVYAARGLLGALASLSGLALVLLHTLPALGQDLVLVGGSVGCIDKVPGPPSNLKVRLQHAGQQPQQGSVGRVRAYKRSRWGLKAS